ncbi:hypothetical protein BC827DRAFT_613288 [Russula dissimulans]|nr:hypothetical protein BC827DRAFT_613288 [Russula dissimulans]
MWVSNCTAVSPPSTYPYPIPAGTSIPHWAFLDVTIANNWSPAAAQTAGDSPEETPTGTSSTVVYSPSSSTSSNQNKSHSGAIAGAVVGALVGAPLVIGIIFWYLRRWRLRAAVQPASPTVHEAFVNAPPIPVVINLPHTETQPTPSAGHAAHTDSQPVRGAARISEAFGLPDPDHSMAIGRYYDPLDPNTFPILPVPLPMSTIQIASNRRDGHNDAPSGSTHVPQYSGLPLV